MSGAAVGIVFAFLVATGFGALFHLVFGGSAGKLVLYIAASFVGFGLGHFVGVMLRFDAMKLGAIYFLAASVGSWSALFFARWLWSSAES